MAQSQKHKNFAINLHRRVALIVWVVFWGLALGTGLVPTAQAGPLRIEVFKTQRQLVLFDGTNQVKSYRIALGNNPGPAKEKQGDGATPEGAYYLCYKNPRSQYYLSLAISYPGPADARRGLKKGLISQKEYNAILAAHAKSGTPPWNTKLGGAIFVHGNGSSPDWTLGCIALDDADMKDLYQRVTAKIPITIHH